jgi:ribose transport system ATP-binding protein
MSDTPLLEVRGLCKRFPGVRALHEVNLTLRRGEVLALIGENGAGKSTLMKILAGVQGADSGELLIDGKPVHFDNVNDAMDAGVVLIHQELNLCDNLDVASNIYLGREPLRAGLIDKKNMRRDARRVLDLVGLNVDPATPLHRLTIGHQQLVEIAKALSVNARVLIMDEPTSSLSQHETENLFRVVKDLRRRGVSVIYISHRLGEVKQLADRVTVLRDGQNAGDLDRDRIDHDTMVRMMVGRDISQFYARKQHPVGDVLLEVRDLVTPAWPRHPISFSVRAGEIVGFAGLIGAGRTQMLRALFGIDKPLGGSITFDGKPLDAHDPRRVIGRGMALVPEDRKQHGLIVEMSVRHNMGLPGLRRHSGRGGWLNQSRENADAASMIDRMNIRTPSADQIVQYLSGGNQQKVVIGKWLCLGPKLLLLDEPTRGVDVGAKQEIYRLMEQLAEQGMGIVFVSSEMEEILGMSDRVLVMHEGRITGELSRRELSEQAIMHLATGAEGSLV